MGVRPRWRMALQTEGVVALGETAAVVVHHQAAVIPRRDLEAEGAVEQNLARGGLEQVGAANH